MGFSRKHGMKIERNIAAKLTEKFKNTGRVTEQVRSSHTCTSSDKDTIKVMLGVFARSPKEAVESGVSRSSIMCILKEHKWQ
jgi:Mg2+/Co2+ transporter CorC